MSCASYGVGSAQLGVLGIEPKTSEKEVSKVPTIRIQQDHKKKRDKKGHNLPQYHYTKSIEK